MRKSIAYMRIQEMVSEWSGRLVSWSIIVMVGVLIWEIARRYIFSAPTTWAHELSTMLYGSSFIIAGAYTLLHRQHVRMDAIYRLFPRRVRAVLDCVTGLLAISLLVLFLWVSIKFTADSWAMREFSGASTWAPPLHPFKAAITLGVLLTLLQAIVRFIRDLSVLLGLKNR